MSIRTSENPHYYIDLLVIYFYFEGGGGGVSYHPEPRSSRDGSSIPRGPDKRGGTVVGNAGFTVPNISTSKCQVGEYINANLLWNAISTEKYEITNKYTLSIHITWKSQATDRKNLPAVFQTQLLQCWTGNHRPWIGQRTAPGSVNPAEPARSAMAAIRLMPAKKTSK